MKKLLLTLCLTSALFGQIGCAFVTHSYATLSATELAVDSAYKAYNDLLVQGKIPIETLPKVSNSYDTFQSAMRVAILVARSNPESPASADLASAAAEVIAIINKAEGK